MTSNDKYITIEMFNEGIQRIEAKIQNGNEQIRQELKTEVQGLSEKVLLNNAKIDWLQHTIYWGFAILAIVIALLQLAPARNEKKKEKSEWTERDLRALIREEISMARNIANAGK